MRRKSNRTRTTTHVSLTDGHKHKCSFYNSEVVGKKFFVVLMRIRVLFTNVGEDTLRLIGHCMPRVFFFFKNYGLKTAYGSNCNNKKIIIIT
jgi:hypothetical protein